MNNYLLWNSLHSSKQGKLFNVFPVGLKKYITPVTTETIYSPIVSLTIYSKSFGFQNTSALSYFCFVLESGVKATHHLCVCVWGGGGGSGKDPTNVCTQNKKQTMTLMQVIFRGR
jgi:hypothetical protein